MLVGTIILCTFQNLKSQFVLTSSGKESHMRGPRFVTPLSPNLTVL